MRPPVPCCHEPRVFMAAVPQAHKGGRAAQEMVKRGLHTLSKAEYQLM